MKKFVHLSDANLEKVWNWCEASPANELAEMYMNSCGAYANALNWNVNYHLVTLSAQFRDTIGREILAVMKRESELQ